MSRLTGFEIISFGAARVIGRQVTHSVKTGATNPVPELWQSMLRDGTLSFLQNLAGRSCSEADCVGWMGDFDPRTQAFVYLAGVLTRPGTPVPEGFVCRDIPDCVMSVGWIEGNPRDGDLYKGASGHVAEARKQHGYEYDGASGGFEMEYYPYDRFHVPLERGDEVAVMGYYSPSKPVK